MDIPSFLRLYPPFDALDEDRLDELVRATRIEFHGAGEIILRQGGAPAEALYVLRKGAVELVDDEQVIDLLSEGEVFGHTSMLSAMSPTFTCRAHEDTIVYLIEREAVEPIFRTNSGLAFLSSSLRRRLSRALDGLNPEAGDPWQTPVGTLVRRPPVTIARQATVRQAARTMTEQRVSSLLVELDRGHGIVTDRDLRSRVLSLGLSPETPVEEIMTEPVISVGANAMAAEVSALMLERGVHHVPVTDGEGTVLGLVTEVDLMGLEQKAPFLLKADIERASTPGEVVDVGRRSPDAICTLVEANVDPVDVGHVMAVVVDSLTRRLLELGIREIGDPPCPWAWLALGSEARQEQAMLTDQDNALAIEPGEVPQAAVDPYFQRLATFVNDQLEQAGIPRCKAGVNASNPDWRHTPLEWEAQFRRWMTQGTWVGGAMTAIAFDYRQIAGPLDVGTAFDRVIRDAASDERFIKRIGMTALEARPPTGFVRDSVIHPTKGPAVTLDIKQGGVTLITNLARTYALMSGLSENRTLRRLHQVASTGRLSQDSVLGLEEAFRLLWQARLEHQAQQVRAGVPPDDQVDPASLGPLARQGLKDAFRMIDRAQDVLASKLGVGR
jgi:CBS domain-containing protein